MVWDPEVAISASKSVAGCFSQTNFAQNEGENNAGMVKQSSSRKLLKG
jgi:hypothetical protein